MFEESTVLEVTLKSGNVYSVVNKIYLDSNGFIQEDYVDSRGKTRSAKVKNQHFDGEIILKLNGDEMAFVGRIGDCFILIENEIGQDTVIDMTSTSDERLVKTVYPMLKYRGLELLQRFVKENKIC